MYAHLLGYKWLRKKIEHKRDVEDLLGNIELFSIH